MTNRAHPAAVTGDRPDHSAIDRRGLSPDRRQRPVAGAGEVHRRPLTIMFVDLAGSTELVASQDIEVSRDILLAFLSACAARIEAHLGYVARFMGDGVLAYFGYPTVHGEDAHRAVAAALDIQQTVATLPEIARHGLAARIGIATGDVLIGDIIGRGAASECMVVGEAANLAARLQASAAPGSILLSQSTATLVGDAFVINDAGTVQLKGIAHPVATFEPVRQRRTDRFSARSSRGLTAMAGRDAELATLTSAWAQVDRGSQLVAIIGEAGIGKSRMAHALRDQLDLDSLHWLCTHGTVTARSTPFYGLMQLLRHTLDPQGRLQPVRITRRLSAIVRRLGLTTHTAGRLAQAGGLPLGRLPPTPVMSVSEQLLLLQSDLIALLRRICASGSLVLMIEDAHWLDAATVDLLTKVWSQIAELPILVMILSRAPVQLKLARSQVLTLQPLNADALQQLAQAAAGVDLEPAVLADIAARSQGIPLFAEELARLLAQPSAQAQGTLPATLQELLLARLDRADHGLIAAQMIAVLGEDATLGGLADLTGRDPATLRRTLDQLQVERVIHRTDGDGHGTIAFRHALYGEVAYHSLPKNARAAAHLAAARHLLGDRETSDRPDRIARHFDLAGDFVRARKWWSLAGRQARRLSAIVEARNAYQRAIALTSETRGDGEGETLLLQLHSALLETLQLSEGYSAPATKAVAADLRRLVEQQGDLRQQLIAATGEWAAASSAGEYDLANEHAARAPAIASALGTADALATAAMIQITARYRCGDLIGAEEAFRAGEQHFHTPQFFMRPGSIAQTFGNAAINAWLLGDDDAARARIAMLAKADEALTDPYSLAFSRHMASMALLLLEDLPATEQAARAALAIAEQAGFPQYTAISRITLGGALCGQGDGKAGLTLIREGIRMMEKTGSRAAITLYHCWLAQAEQAAGQARHALGTITRGLEICPQERYVIPDLLRLRGVLEGELGRPHLMATLLNEAADAAQAMQAGGLFRRVIASQAAAGLG